MLHTDIGKGGLVQVAVGMLQTLALWLAVIYRPSAPLARWRWRHANAPAVRVDGTRLTKQTNHSLIPYMPHRTIYSRFPLVHHTIYALTANTDEFDTYPTKAPI
jgi:hypothetical protein